jgi:hypothetical protein
MPHNKILQSIELFGTKVAPAIRKELGGGLPISTREIVKANEKTPQGHLTPSV